MNTPSELGEKVLVLVENCQDCVEQLRTIVSQIENTANRTFTLLHCCPPKYWEHGASAEASDEASQAWQAAEAEFSESEGYLRQARNILVECGVPAGHIGLQLAVNNSVEGAVTTELRRGGYSGVILCSDHSKVIQWVSRRDLSPYFTSVPEVTIQTFEPELPPQFVDLPLSQPQSYMAATL